MEGLGTSDIVARVQGALLEDARTGEFGIEVIDHDGVITLTGAVDSEKTREAAEEIARQQEGVLEVINDLEVKENAKSIIVPPRTTSR
jgi:osmotically-inducible protein OsmY